VHVLGILLGSRARYSLAWREVLLDAIRYSDGSYCARYPGQSFPRCCTSSQVGTDGARGSLALMSNESMIRGGGPEAWRHLDLADEAKSKPPVPLLVPSLSSLFSFCYLRLVLFASRIPLVLRLSVPGRRAPPGRIAGRLTLKYD